MSICYVTSFIDIGRKDWKTFYRSSEEYFIHFLPFVEFFQQLNSEEKRYLSMIVFIDEIHYDQLYKNIPDDIPISLISCSNDYLIQHIHGWSYLPIQTEIMKSEKYKQLVGDRIFKFPENYCPKYTTITNCKVDFVVHAMTLTDASYLCWVDFGYFKLRHNIPSRPLDLKKLNTNRINIQLISALDERDKDIIYTMKVAPERVAGAFVFGPRDKFLEYQELYHLIQQEFHTMQLVDDDQHIALRCYFRKPELFQLHIHFWSTSLVLFQKDLI